MKESKNILTAANLSIFLRATLASLSSNFMAAHKFLNRFTPMMPCKISFPVHCLAHTSSRFNLTSFYTQLKIKYLCSIGVIHASLRAIFGVIRDPVRLLVNIYIIYDGISRLSVYNLLESRRLVIYILTVFGKWKNDSQQRETFSEAFL